MKKIVLIILISTLGAILAWCVGKTDSDNITNQSFVKEIQKPLFEFKETSFDFWEIKQSWWKVIHKFEFTYNWKSPIKITWVPTSCACTTASIDKTQLNPWDKATLKVVFNPNLHAEPQWKFFKTITILTDPKLDDAPEVKIWTQIDLDLWTWAYELKADHDDDNDH